MATAKANRIGDSGFGHRQPSRWKRNLVLLATVLAGGVLAFSWDGLREQARISTAYGARQGCICRYVSNRPLDSCHGDIAVAGLRRTASLMFLSEAADRRAVNASVPLLSSQTATFDPAGGCQLQPWED